MKLGKTSIAIIILAIAVVVLLAVAYALPTQQQMPKSFRIRNQTYDLTAYAYTPQQQEQGLMNAPVTNSTFMLFAFGQEGIYPFWMKNTYTPLDIVWINYSTAANTGRIVYSVNATPCASYDAQQSNCIVYIPKSEANYVIETKSGFLEEHGIKNGTAVMFIYK